MFSLTLLPHPALLSVPLTLWIALLLPLQRDHPLPLPTVQTPFSLITWTRVLRVYNDILAWEWRPEPNHIRSEKLGLFLLRWQTGFILYTNLLRNWGWLPGALPWEEFWAYCQRSVSRVGQGLWMGCGGFLEESVLLGRAYFTLVIRESTIESQCVQVSSGVSAHL